MSTIVRSDLRTRPCLRKAGAINYHVYLRNAASVHPDLRPWFNAVAETWEEPIVKANDQLGFYSEFYKPKHPPDSPGYCPPVLAFRGSETNPSDFAKLGIVIRIELSFDSTRFASGFENLLDAVTRWFSPFEFAPASPAPRTADREEAVAACRALAHSRQIAHLSGTADVRIRRPNMASPLLLPMVDETLQVTYNISATVHFEDEGDYGTNIAQGMGEEARQYRMAAIEGKTRAKEAMDDWNGKIIMTGHSLGGGLAALAAISGKYHHSDCDISCVTYNAVGLHENSVHEYVNLSATLGQNPSTANFSVNDEVLNTLQLQQNKLPLVQPIIRWANAINPGPEEMSFSEARNTTAITPGISPGSTYMGYWAPTYEPLPKLWPLSENTVAEAQARLEADPATQEYVRQQRAARQAIEDAIPEPYSDVDPFIAEEEALWDEYDRLGGIGTDNRMREIQGRLAEIEAERAAWVAENQQALTAADNVYETREPSFSGADLGKFPLLTQIDAMARGCNRPEQFIRGLVGWLLDGDMNPDRPSTYDIRGNAVGHAITRGRALVAEAGGIVPIGTASVAYHTFDPCAFTFHNPRG